MHNIASYHNSLVIYMFVILFVAFVLFAVINLIFYLLKKTKLFYEKKVWYLVNLVVFLILVAIILPVILDVTQSSYCEIVNVVNIQTEYKANNSSKYILITDIDGTIYTCYDFLINTESLQNIEYPGTLIYAKHSKLILDYYN